MLFMDKKDDDFVHVHGLPFFKHKKQLPLVSI